MSGNKNVGNSGVLKCTHLDCRRGYLDRKEEEMMAGRQLEAELFRAVEGGEEEGGAQRPRGDDDDKHEEVVESWNCLRNPETRQMVSDFQQNIFKLLASTTARVAAATARRAAAEDQDQPDLGIFGEIEDDEELGEDVRRELEVCKRFATQLYLNGGEGGKKFMEGAAQSTAAAADEQEHRTMESLMKEMDTDGVEFNPFRLVKAIGDRLGYMGQLLEMLCEEKNRLKEKANQVEARLARANARRAPVLGNFVPPPPALEEAAAGEEEDEVVPNEAFFGLEELFEEDDEIDFEPDSSDEQ